MQALAGFDSAADAFFLVGDMNDDINDSPDNPAQFFSEPSGAPVSFNLGNDISFPLANSVFQPLAAGSGPSNLTVLNPLQLISQGGEPLDSTRPASGRRLDYIWYSDAVTLLGSEVYDSRDEAATGLPKFGSPLPAGTSATASDHLLVFADYSLTPTEGACCQPGGICVEGVDETTCLDASGTFYGIETTCDPPLDPPCDPPDIDVVINEVLASHDGPDTNEFIELFGTPNGDLFGLTLLVIEGETLSKGLVDLTVSLNGLFLDGNGYLVVGDTAVSPDVDLGLGDRLENGTQTVLLVRGYVAPLFDDVDGDNDGIAEANIGEIVDSVGLADAGLGSSDVVYYGAPVVGPQAGAFPAGGARIPNGLDTDSASDWQFLSAMLDGTDGDVAVTPDTANLAATGDGDLDDDGDIDLGDAARFAICFTGAGGGPVGPACEDGDMDGDTDIDLADHGLFQPLLDQPQ
jgi:hypothetical protein